MTKFTHQQYSVFAAILIASFTAAGCTQIREARFPEGAGENIFERALFTSSSMSLSTDAAPKRIQKHSRKVRASQQADAVTVRQVAAPESIRSMFKALEIAAAGEKQYAVKFRLDRQFLTSYRVVGSADELSIQDLQLATKVSESEYWAPLFQYRIQAYGQVVRAKNDLGEDTSTLRLRPSEWKDATHIQVSTLPEDRLAVATSSPDDAERVFVRAKLDGSVFSREELASELDIRVDRAGQFETVIDGGEMVLQELVSLESEAVTPAQRELVAAQDRGAPVSAEISRCSKAAESRLQGLVSNCVRVARYRVPLTHVEARRRQVDADGTLSAEVEFRPVARTHESRLVQIAKDPLVAEMGVSSLDPRRSLKVAELKNQEFLFRRTMEDSPNSFDYTFAGSSGPLELVRILFEKDRVRLVRADAMIKTGGNNRIDLADLMSLPVQYVREVSADAQGNLLARPRVIPADHTHPDAVAYVSWEGNSVPPISSPLNYYELGQCFVGPTDVTVSEVDHRLSQAAGVLSFSLNMTYANNPGADCAGVFQAGYFDRVQASFTFKERISLKKYAKGDESPLLELPYDAQKKLGFGIFTYKKNSPNRYGNIGSDGTETALPALFDVRAGKKVRYVLAGLPAEGELREAIVKATREVVADWNEAFRKAFKGTTLDRSDDVLELAVEGEKGISPSALGDLDTNHIYFIPKRTSSGVIGLGGAHSNPRSGKVEAASVFIYGGNILSFVDQMRKLEASKKEYLKQVASPLVKAGTPSEAGVRSSGGTSGSEPRASGRISRERAVLAQSRLGLSSAEKMESLSKLPRKPSELALYEAMQEAVRAGRLGDARFGEKVFSQKLLQVMAGRVGGSRLAALKSEVRRAESVSGLIERMEKANLCVHEAAQLTDATLPEGLAEKSDIDLVVGVYKPTLAHELGHNLGLRHNFIGSFDQANWKFSPSDSSKRDYSSIMDYLASDHETYDGLGPYDVAAIRAAYAGMVEGQDGSLVSLEQVKSALKISSWLQLSSEQVSKLPIRHFQFCSDEEAGETPVCNRFDRGATPTEIVKANIEDYRSLYTLSNFAGDRLHFSQAQSGGYIGRLFAKFLAIRQFLEETMYQAINGADGEVINEYAKAAFESMQFFHSVIRTPDAPASATEAERVMELSLQDGRTIKVERRWLKDVGFEQGSDRLSIRGIEFDKVVALMMLTDRQLGFPRYEAASLRFSFPEFERMVFAEAKSPLELPTLALLQEVLSNQIRPNGIVLNEKGASLGAIPLDGRFKADTTEMIRFYAMVGAVVSQDVDGLEAKDNGSRLFRVMSGFAPAANSVTTVRPGTARDDGDQLKYWAPSESVVAQTLVGRLAALEAVGSQSKAIASEFVAMLAQVKALAAAESEGKADAVAIEKMKSDVAAAQQALDVRLASLPESVGSRQAEDMVGVVTQVEAVSTALAQAQAKLRARDFAMILDLRRTQVGNLLKANPALAVAVQAVASQEGASSAFKMLALSASNESEQGVVFGNIETLSRLTLTLHPELRR